MPQTSEATEARYIWSAVIAVLGILMIVGCFAPAYQITFTNVITKSVFSNSDYSIFTGFVEASKVNHVGKFYIPFFCTTKAPSNDGDM